jgi:hypothetical protein
MVANLIQVLNVETLTCSRLQNSNHTSGLKKTRSMFMLRVLAN